MEGAQAVSPAGIQDYLQARPRAMRWREWLSGRRYLFARLHDRPVPLVIIAHSFRDARRAHQMVLAIEEDWPAVPDRCREAYNEILQKAPGLVVVQLRRKNVCGCLGHRHLVVKEAPFAEPHEAFGGVGVGEIDIAYDRVATWKALPLSDTAFDTKFLQGSRLEEFHIRQFRLRLLSVLLHEINHLVFPHQPEAAIRERSLSFYHDALATYVEAAMASLSFTIDRSFSRLGRE